MENQIEKIRSKKKLSQKNLADKIDISVAELAEIEANETDLSVEMLTKISDALNVSVDSLLKKKTIKNRAFFCSVLLF